MRVKPKFIKALVPTQAIADYR